MAQPSLVQWDANALLVVSVDAVGVTRLPKLLHDAGLRVTLLGRPGLAVARSRFVQRRLLMSADPHGLLQTLRQHLQPGSPPYRLIVLADEPLIWAAARQQEQAWMQAWFPVACTETALTRITSKIAFITGAADHELPLPRFLSCMTLLEAQAAAKEIGYPAVVKTAQGFAGSAVRFVHDEADLVKQSGAFVNGQPFLVQQFIDGEVGATPVLFDHGRPVWWFSYLMLDPWPHRFAAATTLKIVDHEEIESLLHGVGVFTGFHGLGAIDWVREPDSGRLFLIEFNPRPTPALYLGARAGRDCARALSTWLAGESPPFSSFPALQSDRQKIYLFPQHLYAAIDHHRSSTWLATWRDAPWSDPLLLAAHLRRVGTHYLPSRWKQQAKAIMQTGGFFRMGANRRFFS